MNTVIEMAETRLNTYFALLAFIVGGIVCVSTMVIWIFATFEHLKFDGVITFVLLCTFLLFGLGAHCLDVEERRKRNSRD